MPKLVHISLPYHANTSALFERVLHLPYPILMDSCSDKRTQQSSDMFCAQPEWVFVAKEQNFEIFNKVLQVCESGDKALEKLLELEQSYPQNLLGYFGYHCKDNDFNIPYSYKQEGSLPDICIGFYNWRVDINHSTQSSEFVYLDNTLEKNELDTLLECFQEAAKESSALNKTKTFNKVITRSNFSKTAYQDAFNKIQTYINDGDCYQVNLAQCFQADFNDDTWGYYQYLRQQSPAPFACYFSTPFGDVLSFSPESFLSIDNSGKIISQPIKGTRKRDSDSEKDKEAQAELANSKKDRAENLMIVDLIRNDISKNAELNTVQVEQLFDIQSFANVHHMVSTISAQKKASVSHLQVLLDCFPGGSITGAPKKRAMEIIHELEPDPRQVYCGAMGYLSAEKNMEFNIAIRTLVISHGRLYCWGGGGLVADSDMEAEYQESINKISNLIDIEN